MKQIHAVILARAGSKRLPKKNIYPFRGQPLIVWSIKAALACNKIGTIIISTDDNEAINISKNYDVEIVRRPKKLAQDDAGTFDVLKHVYFDYLPDDTKPEFIVLLQPTSPLREIGLIDLGIKSLLAEGDADSLIEVCELRIVPGKIVGKYWKSEFPEETRSQEIEPIYIPSGRLYIYKCANTLEINKALGERTIPVISDYERNVNIDTEKDIEKLNMVFERYKDDFSYLLK